MRFKPALFRSATPRAAQNVSETLPDLHDLPDDLQCLAEQLSSDANYLAERYPAGGRPGWSETSISASDPSAAARSAPWKMRAAVAALLVGSLGLGWWSRRAPQEQLAAPGAALPKPAADAPARDVLALPHEAEAVQNFALHRAAALSSERPHVQPAAETSARPAVVPAGLFLTLSPPEQEALLDVMEKRNLPQSSVSF